MNPLTFASWFASHLLYAIRFIIERAVEHMHIIAFEMLKVRTFRKLSKTQMIGEA